MHKEFIDYQAGNIRCKGYASYDSSTNDKRPVVIVAHAWRGQDPFARKQADLLARLGYIGFAADIYGEGKNAADDEEAFSLMSPLFIDRGLLQTRILAAYNTAKAIGVADKKQMGAIGFCFGGLTVLELLRSGAHLQGVVTFHGLLGEQLNMLQAVRAPQPDKMHGSLLIMHGHDDPLVKPQDIINIQTEMTQCGIDWQMHIFGHTTHAFTMPTANDPSAGLLYNARASTRAFQGMETFFKETFGH